MSVIAWLVIVIFHLIEDEEPGLGSEYRCWIELDPAGSVERMCELVIYSNKTTGGSVTDLSKDSVWASYDGEADVWFVSRSDIMGICNTVHWLQTMMDGNQK